MDEVRIGVVGAGYWGPNLMRAAQRAAGSTLVAICDSDPDRLERIARDFPEAACVTRLDDLLAQELDAVVVATPASIHHSVAKAALESGRHVLVEKPLAMTVAECEQLGREADARSRILMVGHTFLYSEPVRELKRLLEGGELGQLYYISSRRLNMGRVRSDVDALWNLGPHDLSILVHLIGGAPALVTATGASFLQPDIADVVFLTLEWETGQVAHVELSWLSPLKVREMTVVCSEKMVVYDDTSTDGPLAIHDRAFTRAPSAPPEFTSFGEFQLVQRMGSTVIPQLATAEPLVTQMEHFVDCIRTGNRPLTDAGHAAVVVSILEAATESLRVRGGFGGRSRPAAP